LLLFSELESPKITAKSRPLDAEGWGDKMQAGNRLFLKFPSPDGEEGIVLRVEYLPFCMEA
jgi:hypothetical protein